MNRLEREVVEELESDYEHDEDRAKAIIALVREAVLQEIEDNKPDEPDYNDYRSPLYPNQTATGGHQIVTTTNTSGGYIVANAIQQTVQNLRNNAMRPTLNITNMPTINMSVDHLQRFAEVTCECGDRVTVTLELWQDNEGIRKEVERQINMHLRMNHSVMGDPFKLP